ncbi:hypothetical protein FNF27_02087 [Cafeteria roenbergensis]|uniref:Protein kinase domain-containing protein n=1 Tax=Cafeteria roenbergensis TaxID=33653 RepID=A0A5A8EKW5_CAFRO|nr:hypothetical protein FNF31_01303 [Cafeteria roenbergensis]KAA0167309.1 hypothetical protein FNF28_02841 [Cafeteria roenbergensis]KAA0176391.1 hypothetical protein FNF27_02087 [Cafeteria roenbergensis]
MPGKADPDTPLPLVAGLEVGPWVLDRLLGSGSFGQVWSAHTPAPSKEAGPWALKLSQLYDDAALAKRKRNPRAKIRQTQAAQRLFNEYQITALRLRAKMTTEPLAMRCLAFPPSVGATGKGAGYRYLAMRDAGSDLSIVTAALNAFRLPIGAVCAIGVDMVDALRLMHVRADVLHLDLKPDNICISRPADPDPALPACATLIDFTTCMPVRDFKGERTPVSALGVTSFSSLRIEAEPDGGLVPAMDLEGLAIVLAALAGCPGPWFGPEPEPPVE